MEEKIKKYDLTNLKLRDDVPKCEDKFEEKTHEQVAKSLVKLITKEDGGFAIGLEGSWGSGKSTVAKITEWKIHNSEKDKERFVFFTFDTWAHQGDPIRRSFLECLAGKLHQNKIITNNKWARLVRKIRAQQKKVNTSSIPKVPFYNYVMAVFALCVPFLLLWSHYLIQSENTSLILAPIIIFVFFPILAALFAFIIREAGDLETKKLPVIPSFRYLSQEIYTEHFIETEDATTIEFNNHFDELIKYLIKRNKKLVVILDNLDRISSNDFISMWGTMRNFFSAEKESKRDSLLKHVYLIVPFDQKHINEIFNKSSNLRDENDSKIGEEFVDKTFRFVLDVAVPITTNWKAFFKKELDKSFSDQLKEQEVHDVQKLFELYHQDNDLAITPRRIKKFINDLIIQIYERNGVIELKYLALYVLYRNKIKEEPNWIINISIFSQRMRDYLAGEDWVENVAAAQFKVKPKKALQLVLGNKLIKALINSELDDIEEMQNNIGFNNALTDVIANNAKNWAETEASSLAKVAKTLGKITLNNGLIEEEIWKSLSVNTAHLKSYSNLNKLTGEGLALIISKSPDNLLNRTIEHICIKVNHTVGESVDKKKYSNEFFAFLKELTKSIRSRVGEDDSKKYLSKINLPVEPTMILHLSSLFNSQIEMQFENYSLINPNIRSIQDEFIKNIDKGLNSEVLENSLIVLFKSNFSIEWNKIADHINNRLYSNKLLETYEYKFLLSMLTYLRYNDVENAKTHIQKISTNDFLLGVLQNSDIDNKLKAIVVLNIVFQNKKIDKVLNRNRGNAPPFGNINVGVKELNRIFNDPSQYSEIKESLTILFCNYGLVGILLKRISENSGHNKLFVEIFKELLDKNCLNGLSINDVMNYYESLNLTNGDEYFEKFFKQIDEEELNVDEIDNLSIIEEKLIVDSIETNSNFGSNLYQRCQKLLTNLDVEAWTKELNNEGHILKLVSELVGLKRSGFIKRVDFREALTKYNEDVLFSNGRPKSISIDRWSLLPNAMSKTNREAFYKLLYTKLIKEFRTSEVSYNIMKHYGEDFLVTLDQSDRPDLFVKNVLLDLINSNHEEKLDWIIENGTTVKKFLENVTKETRSELEDAITSKDDVEDSVAEKLKIIKGIIKLNKK